MIEGYSIPKGWSTATLVDVCRIVMGQSPPSTTYNVNRQGLPFFQGKKEFGPIYPEPEVYCSSPGKIAEPGAILLSVRAPVGPTNIALERCCIGRGLCALHPGPCLEQMFLFHYLRSRQQSLSGEGTGTTFTAISKGVIENYPVPVAPLVEQRAIVSKIDALFSELDKGIEQLQTIKQQLKQYRKAVLKAAFEGELTATWRAEQQAAGTLTSADDLLERIEKEREARYQQRLDEWKQAVDEWQADGGRESGRRRPSKPSVPKALSDLTEAELGSLYVLPGEWRWVRLGQLCESVRNGISDKPSDSPPGFPILRISAVRPMYVDLSEARYHDRPRGEVETFLIRNGDLLFTRYNGSLHLVGVCGMVRGCNASILHPDKLIRVALAAPSIVSAFVELAANSGVSRDFVVSRARTTAGQTGISGEDVRNIPLPLPSLPELERIVDELSFRLSMLDELEKAVDYATNRAEALRRSILRKAFEGRLLSEAESTDVRNDPEYEPADKLLERIRGAGGTGKQPSRPDRARKRAHPMRPSCPRGNACLDWE